MVRYWTTRKQCPTGDRSDVPFGRALLRRARYRSRYDRLVGRWRFGFIGLEEIRCRHGSPVVQDPSDADNLEMPMTALSLSKPDHVVRLVDLPALLLSLVRKPAGKPNPLPDGIKFEVQVVRRPKTRGSMGSIGFRAKHALHSEPQLGSDPKLAANSSACFIDVRITSASC